MYRYGTGGILARPSDPADMKQGEKWVDAWAEIVCKSRWGGVDHRIRENSSRPRQHRRFPKCPNAQMPCISIRNRSRYPKIKTYLSRRRSSRSLHVARALRRLQDIMHARMFYFQDKCRARRKCTCAWLASRTNLLANKIPSPMSTWEEWPSQYTPGSTRTTWTFDARGKTPVDLAQPRTSSAICKLASGSASIVPVITTTEYYRPALTTAAPATTTTTGLP